MSGCAGQLIHVSLYIAAVKHKIAETRKLVPATVNPLKVRDRHSCPGCLVPTQSRGRDFFSFSIYTVLIRYQWSQRLKIRLWAGGILSLSLSFFIPIVLFSLFGVKVICQGSFSGKKVDSSCKERPWLCCKVIYSPPIVKASMTILFQLLKIFIKCRKCNDFCMCYFYTNCYYFTS